MPLMLPDGREVRWMFEGNFWRLKDASGTQSAVIFQQRPSGRWFWIGPRGLEGKTDTLEAAKAAAQLACRAVAT